MNEIESKSILFIMKPCAITPNISIISMEFIVMSNVKPMNRSVSQMFTKWHAMDILLSCPLEM